MTDTKTGNDITRARGALMQMIQGFRASAIIHATATLGIADAIGEGPTSVEEIAAATGTKPESLLRLLRGLAVLGITEEAAPSRFKLTTVGAGLRSDAPGSLQRVAATSPTEHSMRVWSNVTHTLTTGETTFDHVMGISAFDHFARDPEMNSSFNRQMSEHTRIVAPSLLAAYDFSRYGTIVDVGGGNGTLLAAILHATANPRGVNFDSVAGAETAADYLKTAGVADRCDIVTGDFFQSVPEGGDAYLMKSIIHDWNDELATTLLTTCHRAMGHDARIVILDIVLPDVIDTSELTRAIVFSDLNMLVNTGGRERTLAEFETLLQGARFRITEVTPLDTPWGYHVIEAAPA